MLLVACLPIPAIKSHGYAGVPQNMLTQIRANAAPWKQGGARVPEIVSANIAKPCALQQGLEVPVDYVPGLHTRADNAEDGRYLTNRGQQRKGRAEYSPFAPYAREGAPRALVVRKHATHPCCREEALP